MPLDKQIVGVAFTQGLDTQTDKRIVLPGRMVALQNTTLSEEDTFRRRDGNTAIATGTALSGVSTLGDQLLALDGSTVKSYAPNAGALESVGTLDNLTLSLGQIVRGTGGQDSYDAATSSGLTCYVWRDFTAASVITGCKVVIKDETTGATVLPETFLKTGTTIYCPRVVVVTGAFLIFYGNSASTTLYARVVQTSAPSTLGAETSLRTDLSTNIGKFAACASSGNAFLYYVTDDATTSTRAITVVTSGTTPSVSAGPLNVTSQAQVASTHIGGVAASTFSASLIGVYLVADSGAGTPGLWGAVVTSAMASSAAAASKDTAASVLTISNVTAVLNGSTMFVYSDDFSRDGEATATARLVRRTGLDSTNAITSASTTPINSMTRPNGTNGPFIAGKAFLVGSTVYLPMFILEAGTGSLQNAWFLVNDSARVVARALYGTSGPPSTLVNNLGTAIALSATSIGLVVGQRTFLSFAAGVNVSVTGMARIVLDFSASDPLIRVPLGPSLALANSTLSVFDGLSATEAGFYLFPEVVTAVQGAAGGVVDAGDHQIVALYEWIDGAGQRHQSAPSVAITYTAADSAHHCTVTIPTLALTQKTGVNVVVFATKAAGTIFYRVNAVNAPLANSTTAPTVTFDYNVVDTVLERGELLYTTGGILPNNSPPPTSAIAAHQDRLFITVDDDPFAFQYSQPWVSGFGVQWNETLRGRVESTGGTIKAFASLDDKLIIFRPRKIGVLFGNGPSTTGAQNGYQPVQDLPVDVGCSEPRSVLVLPEGVIFKSTSKGWYRLGRDLHLQWIGEGVQEFDGQSVTSAVLMDTLREARFTLNNNGSDSIPMALVYAYERRGEDGVGQWSTFLNGGFSPVDAVWWPGGNSYVFATATSLVKELPPNASGYAYGDFAASLTSGTGGTAPADHTGLPIATRWRTGWLKPSSAIQGFQRVWRVLLTGDVVGYPQPGTTLQDALSPGDRTLHVYDTSVFATDSLGTHGLRIGLATANYEVASEGFGYSIVDSTHLLLTDPTGVLFAHSGGATVRGTPAFGARGSLVVNFYFDGKDTTPYQTITISDVNDLVDGNAWNVRLQPNLQKCNLMMVEAISTPPTIPAQSGGYVDPGASINFSGMTLEVGVKKGARKYPAAQTK